MPEIDRFWIDALALPGAASAPNVGSGEVVGRHYKRRRRVEFLDFMNRVVAAYPERQIHVVLDNLSTHKPTRDMWLKRHNNVHFHYTPTHASDRNLVLGPHHSVAQRRLLRQRQRTRGPHQRFH
ncbi:MAG: transposase [Xanthobacteraceae bacterium]